MATKKKRPRGRPTTLTKEIASAIFAKLRSGMPVTLAAASIGVAHYTILEWLRRGESTDERSAKSIYVEFARSYRQARAQGAEMHLQRVNMASMGRRPSRTKKNPDGSPAMVSYKPNGDSIRASMWALSRGWPEHWGLQRENVAVELDLVDEDSESASEAGGGVRINVILTRDDDPTTP